MSLFARPNWIRTLVLSFALLAAPLWAANQTWDGGSGVNGNWSTVANWNGDTAAPGSTAVMTSADVATFSTALVNGWGLSGTPIIISSTTQNIGSISFTGSVGNYTLGVTGGNALNLSNGGTIQLVTLTSSNAIETINAPLVLRGLSYTLANNSANNGGGSGTLIIGGSVIGVAGATVLTLDGSNTTANTLSGIIGDGTATSMSITKSGIGTWILTGANSYGGSTTVSAGVLNIRNARALGTVAAGTTVASGAALQLQGGIVTLAEALTLNGTGISTNGALRNINGDNTYVGLITLGSTTRINSDAGTLTLSNGGTITGATYGLTVAGEGNTVINSIIGTTSGTLSKVGGGTLTLSGANTYSGTTTVYAGALIIRHASALGDATSGTSVFSTGAAVQIQGGITTLAEALSLNGNGVSNTGALRNLSDDNTYAGLLTLANSTRINSDAGTLTLSNAGTITGGAVSLTLGGDGNILIQSILSSQLGALIKDGSGTVTLAGANVYTRATNVSGGTLRAGIVNAFGNGSAVTLANLAGATLDLNGFSAQIAGLSGGGSLGGNVTLGGAVLTVAAASSLSPYAGVISGGALIKSSSGTLILTGANTYTGTTTLSAGTLQLGNGGTGGSLSASSAVINNATLIFNRSNSVTQGTDFASVISGSGAVRQNGPGTLTFSGLNTYSGRTTVNGGTMVLAFGTLSSNIISSSSPLTLGGGTLQLTGSGTQTMNGLTTTTGTGSKIILGSSQTLTLGALAAPGTGAALNFDTTAGGGNGAAVGSGVVVLTGQTADSAINSAFTVTDAGGFGLATVNSSNQIVRLTTTSLLPVSGAISANNYRLDNNAGGSATAGSSSLAITTTEAAKSLTVDTSARSGGVTLNSTVVFSANIWNFGGTGSNAWQISNAGAAAVGTGLKASTTNTTIEINNYASGTVTFSSPILDNTTTGVNVKGTGTTVFAGANVYIGSTTIRGGTLEVASSGSITHASADMVVGNASGDNGRLKISGGTVSDSSGFLGYNLGSTGVAIVTGGSWTSSSQFMIGVNGTGILNISGGTVGNTGFIGSTIGSSVGSNGVATVSGGSWASASLTVGDSGSGVLNVSGTGAVSSTGSTLGGSAGGSGVVTVSGGSWTNSNYLTIGSFGSGALNVSGGNVSNTSGTIASTTGSTGVVTVSSGSWTNSGDLVVGNGGNGTLIVTGGTVSNAEALLGSGSGADVRGTVLVSGGTWNNTGAITVGGSGTGILNIGGGNVNSTGGTIGSQTNGNGVAMVSSGSWISSGGLDVGSSGSGVLNIDGGTVSNSNGSIGSSGGRGMATVSAGIWINTGTLSVGSGSTGTLTITGSGVVYVGGVTGTGTLTLGGSSAGVGTLNLGSGGVAGTLNATTVTSGFGMATVNFNETGGYNFATSLTGSIDVNKLGSGSTTLASANTYSGTTTVSDGQLHLGASMNATNAVNVDESAGTLGIYSSATNSFTVQNAAVLSGNTGISIGSVNSTVTIGSGGAGILAPGGSLGAGNGILTINHDLVIGSGAMIELGISAPTVATILTYGNGVYSFNGSSYATAADLFNSNFGGIGANSGNASLAASLWNVTPNSSANHDYINIVNILTLSNLSKVHVVSVGGVTYSNGQVFNLIDWGTLINNGFSNPTGFTTGGVWGDFYLPDLGSSGLVWDTSAFLSRGVLVVVPEPNRMILLMFGFLGCLFRRRNLVRQMNAGTLSDP